MALYPLFVLPLLAAALTSIFLVGIVVPRRAVYGALALIVMLLAAAIWTGAAAWEFSAPDLDGKLLAAKTQYIGIIMLVPAWFLFTVQFTRRKQWIADHPLGPLWLSALPLLALLLVWTNERHGLIWSSTALDLSTPIPTLSVTHGPAFWLLVGYDYLLLVVGTFWLGAMAARSQGTQRRQALALLIGIVPVWLANALYVAHLGPLPWIDLSPYAMTLTGIVYAWSLLHLRLLDVVPLARSAIFDFIEDAIVVVDAQQRIVDSNRAAQSLNIRGQSTLAGSSISQLLAVDLLALDALPPGGIQPPDITPAVSGADRTFEVRSSPLRHGEDKAVGHLLVLHDVTKRKEAEKALQELAQKLEQRVEERTEALQAEIGERQKAEAQLRYQANLLENVSDAVISMDEQFRIRSWNHAAEVIYGYSHEEVLGRLIGEVLATTFLSGTTSSVVEALVAQGFWEGEALQVNRDGVPIVVWSKVSTVKDDQGNILGTVTANRDISGLRKMQEALQEAEQRYRSLFEDAPAMYVTAERRDDKLVIVDCNALFVATLGYEREQLLGQPLAPLLASGSGGTLALHRQTPGGSFSTEDCALVTCDNRVLEMLLRTRYEHDEAGRVTGLRAMFIDISERKRMERQLRETTEQLHALGRHLESIREQEQRRIAREIHDELGQMLTVFKLDLAWLARHSAHCDTEILQKLALMTEHTGATIKTVQRIAAELRPAILDNLGLVAAIEWLARNFEVRTGIVCTFTYNNSAALMDETDLATALFRVCQEALTNVARHAEAGNVHLRLHVTQAEILLEIQDDGIGITPEQAREPNSFGMLSMRERLYPWDGRLSVESAPGEGTRLCIAIDRLPTMESAQ